MSSFPHTQEVLSPQTHERKSKLPREACEKEITAVIQRKLSEPQVLGTNKQTKTPTNQRMWP